jgi:drug/metabolite transporter (DMT)-like permease
MKSNKDFVSDSSGFVYAKLHFIVIILGFSAILGKLISLDASALFFFRTLFAAAFLVGWGILTKDTEMFNKRALLQGIWVGILLAAHWITFFHSIKVSNVSVTLGCFASTTLFVSFLEPFFDRKRLSLIDVAAGLIIIAGIYIIFRFELKYVEGIIYSVISAFLSALFSVFNKYLSYKYNHKALSLSQLIVACVVTFVFILITDHSHLHTAFTMTNSDFVYLLILASVGTAYAYTATIHVINRLNAYVVILAINLEPVYGIILARLIFGESESMTGGFYLGASIIVLTVFLHSFLKKLIQRS